MRNIPVYGRPGVEHSPVKRGWPSDLYAKACRTTAVGHSGVMVSLEGILQLSSHVVVECTASAFGLGGDGLALATRLAPPVEPSAAIGPATIRTSWNVAGDAWLGVGLSGLVLSFSSVG